MNEQVWNLDDDLGDLEARAPKARTADPDAGSGHPIASLVEKIPLIAQMYFLHLQVAVGIPIVILTYWATYKSRLLPEILIGSCPVGFAIGLWLYFKSLKLYLEKKDNRFLASESSHPTKPSAWSIIAWTVRAPVDLFFRSVPAKYYPKSFFAAALPASKGSLPPKPSGWSIIAWTVGAPVAIFLGSVLVIWCRNRFLAAALPAAITGYLFYAFGDAPVKFFEQFLLCQPGMPYDDRTNLQLAERRPNLPLLYLILAGIVSVPILVSNTFALILLTFGLCVVFSQYAGILWRAAPGGAAIWYFLTFAYRICQWFVNYPEMYETERPDEDRDQWAPPMAEADRKLIAWGLTTSLLLTLLVTLTYYCPWQFFAKLSTDLPPEITNTTALHGYTWLFAPFLIATFADPLSTYLFCFVFAVAGFLLIPPAVLLAIYFPRLLELEAIHQRVKAIRSGIQP